MKVSVFWFRRDLRLEDNRGLYELLSGDLPVLPVFIFDQNILENLNDHYDKRVTFIAEQLHKINQKLESLDTSILIKYGKPYEVWQNLINEYEIDQVAWNHDYEPYAIQRDEAIQNLLKKHNISSNTYKDQVIFEYNEVLKDDGKPYTIFTPYSKKWRKIFDANGEQYIRNFPSENHLAGLYKIKPEKFEIESTGFKKAAYTIPPAEIKSDITDHYDKNRNFPALEGTSRLSVHLRFGTVSIRKLVKVALSRSEVWLNELIWREFYMMILRHFPRVVDSSFKPQYDQIAWRNNSADFRKWCTGQTGYPIVDAGMRELNTTGFMHNRVRMITASFLTKHLLIDWRWGEAYFAEKLLDYELSSNNGNWQWVAGTGCDAAPYFRVFNPWIQAQKFDPKSAYIKKWVPEAGESNYPAPMVDHKSARIRAIETYKLAVEKKQRNGQY